MLLRLLDCAATAVSLLFPFLIDLLWYIDLKWTTVIETWLESSVVEILELRALISTVLHYLPIAQKPEMNKQFLILFLPISNVNLTWFNRRNAHWNCLISMQINRASSSIKWYYASFHNSAVKLWIQCVKDDPEGFQHRRLSALSACLSLCVRLSLCVNLLGSCSNSQQHLYTYAVPLFIHPRQMYRETRSEH